MFTYVGSLVQLCCGKRGTLQTNITGVCGECSWCLGHTGFAPAHGMCAFPVYIAQVPGGSSGELSKADHGLLVLPRSKPLRFRFLGTPQGADSVGPAFCAFTGLSSSGDQVLGEHSHPYVGVVSYRLPRPSSSLFWVYNGCAFSRVSCVSSVELISG